jgi:hypothetical protein
MAQSGTEGPSPKCRQYVSTSTSGQAGHSLTFMPTISMGAILKPRGALLLIVWCVGAPALAQQASLGLLQPKAIEPASFVKPAESVTLPEAPSHRFWDRKNSFLFATSAALSTADFVATQKNLRNGGQELNPVTRVFAGSTAGLAANFAGETVG